MDQTLNMKLRFVTAVMVGSSTGDVLAFSREQVWPHILQAVPPSPQLHQHWLDGPFGLNREMVLKWSNTVAGWQTRHAGAMCPHRLPLPPWSVDTGVVCRDIGGSMGRLGSCCFALLRQVSLLLLIISFMLIVN